MDHRLPEPLRLALGELAAIQDALRRPVRDAAELEAIWGRIHALRQRLPALEARAGSHRAVLRSVDQTLERLREALAPIREELRATRALEEAIRTFEEQINRPAAALTRPEQAARLMELLEQLRWKVDSIPPGEDPEAPRARALSSLLEAMDHAGRRLRERAGDLERRDRVAGAERALARIVDEAGDLSSPEALERALARLDALGRSLEATRSSLADTRDLDGVIAAVGAVREQLRGIAGEREAARVIRNAIHGYNAAARSLERGPGDAQLGRSLRAHIEAIAAELSTLRDRELSEALRDRHQQIEAAVRELLSRLR